MLEKVVIVTGFGPFRKITDNPSSQIVDELDKKGVEGAKLVLHKFNVLYDEVSKKVPEMWMEHNPDLVVHVGAHSVERTVYMEQQAFRDGYCEADMNGCKPPNNRAGPCGVAVILKSDIDCEKLVEDVKRECVGFLNRDEENGIKVLKSEDPGRYLCSFTYFTSLLENKAKSLFVHVPPFDSTCSREDYTQIIRKIIKCILKLP